MKDTPQQIISQALADQRAFFATQQTKKLEFRLEQLRKLKAAINKYQDQLQEALWIDLHKSNEEAYITEISIVNQEIEYHIKHLKRWMKAKRVSTPLHLLPSSGKIMYEPLGVALIVAPWNYPFQLLINPLVGAISGGCCAMLKPSPYTPTVAKVMDEMIANTFDPNYITMTQGSRVVNEYLFQQRFDIIFYTGSSYVGKLVMKAAAENLTPVILELGGKSPCIVDKNANIDVAAKRIAWGKTINAGQTCIAPDYLFVHQSVKKELLDKIAGCLKEMHGEDIKQSRYYPRIVNEKAVERLQGLLKAGTIHSGGDVDIKEKYIAPTIIDDIKPEDPVMQEEIFGPILPVMTFEHIDQVTDYINAQDKPLAFYYFGKNKDARAVLSKTTSGGGCVNDTLMHIANHHLPFGGVGNSGLGKYHGNKSFLAFSNQRAIVHVTTKIDLPFKYAPFKYFKWLKKII
jgi:aldehyde dehydrogenase (NAD+)